MNGDELLKEISRRIMARKGTHTVSDSLLAKELGVTQPALQGYRGKDLTPKQVANLMEKSAKRATRDLAEESIIPIVEFLEIQPCETSRRRSWQIFSEQGADGKPHPFWSGLRNELDRSHGIYLFHDSRGRAIYAGKAHRQTLWKELNSAFNRERGEIQSIKRVAHPTTRTAFRNSSEIQRKIQKEEVPLLHLAAYVSAYSVPDQLIGKMEALLVRAFANDLLNVRMENF